MIRKFESYNGVNFETISYDTYRDLIDKRVYMQAKEKIEIKKILKSTEFLGSNKISIDDRSIDCLYPNGSLMYICLIVDEYYLIQYNWRKGDNNRFSVYYKCDQISGIVSLLKSLKIL